MPTVVPIRDTEMRAALPFGAVAAQGLELVRQGYAAARSERGCVGVPTGLPALDKALGGLQTGLHVLAAAPGAGKTSLALNIARHAAATHKLPVVYLSVDELPARLALKLLAASAGLSMSRMTAGDLSPALVAEAIESHAPALSTLSFVAADARLTPLDLSEQLTDRLAHTRADIGLLIVDYLQPFAAALAPQMEFRMAVGAVALALRDVANRARCPVLMISAQNRGEQGTASLTSLRESSDLEYGADSAMFLLDDDAAMVGSGKYARTLKISKNRFGQNGLQIPLVLDGRTQVFSERA
jgi:replicative DNA helicase